MKKSSVIFIVIAVVIGMGALVYFGIRRARGVPVTSEEISVPQVIVSEIAREIELADGIDLVFWNSLEYQQIDLFYQVMVLPWPKDVVPWVRIKSFHNGENIFFYLEWPDETKNERIEIGSFSDAGAVMFPLNENAPASTLMMGFMGQANIWQWKARQNLEYWTGLEERTTYVDFYYPFEEEELFVVSKDEVVSAANDLISARVATVTRKEEQIIDGMGIYEGGVWRVVFKRVMTTEEPETAAQFVASTIRCAFAVWDGANRDRGGRKSIYNWVELVIQ